VVVGKEFKGVAFYSKPDVIHFKVGVYTGMWNIHCSADFHEICRVILKNVLL
jgi:hypothetical protein